MSAEPPEPFRSEILRLVQRFLEMNRELLPAKIGTRLEQAFTEGNVTLAWTQDAVAVTLAGEGEDALTAALEYGRPGLVEVVVYAGARALEVA